MPVNLAALNLNWTCATQRLAKDVRDDFWPDPIEFSDILSVPKRSLIDRSETRFPSYVPEQNAPLYQIPKANFTLRDSLQLSPFDRLVYKRSLTRSTPPCGVSEACYLTSRLNAPRYGPTTPRERPALLGQVPPSSPASPSDPEPPHPPGGPSPPRPLPRIRRAVEALEPRRQLSASPGDPPCPSPTAQLCPSEGQSCPFWGEMSRHG
jgi:hypothetical protein